MNMGKIFLIVGNKIFPFIALPFLAWFWVQEGGLAFMFLVLGLPLLFGYIAPGIGTNYLKMWRFHDSWTIGHYFIHHGFIYAATFGCVMYFAFFRPASNDWLTLVGNMARAAGILGFVGWTHDMIAIREGTMEVYNEPWKLGAPAEVIAAQYAPLCFSLLGAVYGCVVTLGYQNLVLDKNINSLWWLFPLGLALMSLIITVPFLGWIKQVVRDKYKNNP
jgi:hypothetical protein